MSFLNLRLYFFRDLICTLTIGSYRDPILYSRYFRKENEPIPERGVWLSRRKYRRCRFSHRRRRRERNTFPPWIPFCATPNWLGRGGSSRGANCGGLSWLSRYPERQSGHRCPLAGRLSSYAGLQNDNVSQTEFGFRLCLKKIIEKAYSLYGIGFLIVGAK